MKFDRSRCTDCGDCFPGADFLLETNQPEKPFDPETTTVIGVKSPLDTEASDVGVFSMTRDGIARAAVDACSEGALVVKYVAPPEK